LIHADGTDHWDAFTPYEGKVPGPAAETIRITCGDHADAFMGLCKIMEIVTNPMTGGENFYRG
jgi:hypothetical protein